MDARLFRNYGLLFHGFRPEKDLVARAAGSDAADFDEEALARYVLPGLLPVRLGDNRFSGRFDH